MLRRDFVIGLGSGYEVWPTLKEVVGWKGTLSEKDFKQKITEMIVKYLSQRRYGYMDVLKDIFSVVDIKSFTFTITGDPSPRTLLEHFGLEADIAAIRDLIELGADMTYVEKHDFIASVIVRSRITEALEDPLEENSDELKSIENTYLQPLADVLKSAGWKIEDYPSYWKKYISVYF